jgi:hypothetical protein
MSDVVQAFDIRVFVASLDESPAPELARIAMRRGWPLRRPPTAVLAAREIRETRPCVVVLQVSPRPDEVLKLLRLVRSGLPPVVSIAVAVSHLDEIERAVRAAGASCYLPDAIKNRLLERTVDDILATGLCEANRRDAAGRRSARPNNLLLSSSTRTRAAGLTYPPPSLMQGAEGVRNDTTGTGAAVAAQRA